MKKNVKFAMSAVSFILIFLLAFFPLQNILQRKSLDKPWDMTRKIDGFYNESENEFGVMYFGSSHTYASFSPMEIWQETGIKSYAFATQQQPSWASVVYAKEALKKQNLDLVVLDCHKICSDEEYMEEGANYSYMDDLPMSVEKVALSKVTVPTFDERIPLLFNFFKYHTRWSALKKSDFTYNKQNIYDPYKGFVALPMNEYSTHQPQLPENLEKRNLTKKNEKYLREFVELCIGEGVELWLVKTPSNIGAVDSQRLQSVAEIAEEYGVRFTDFNSAVAYEEIEITAEGNFYDRGHLNIEGATKFSRYFANLMDEYFPDIEKNTNDETWKTAYEEYSISISEME